MPPSSIQTRTKAVPPLISIDRLLLSKTQTQNCKNACCQCCVPTKRIIPDALHPALSAQQQARFHRPPDVSHGDLEVHSTSDGIIVRTKLRNHLSSGVTTVISQARKTCWRGRPADDVRPQVQTAALTALQSPDINSNRHKMTAASGVLWVKRFCWKSTKAHKF